MILRIFDAFFFQNCICWILFGTLTIIFDVLDEIIGKIIESRYIGICPIIDKIIDIGRRLPQIIGDFRDLSAKLSISKMTGELSKIYRYRNKWLIAHPYPYDTGVWLNVKIVLCLGQRMYIVIWNKLKSLLQCHSAWSLNKMC